MLLRSLRLAPRSGFALTACVPSLALAFCCGATQGATFTTTDVWRETASGNPVPVLRLHDRNFDGSLIDPFLRRHCRHGDTLWYHGTSLARDDPSVDYAERIVCDGIDPSAGRDKKDFGAARRNWRSFYVGNSYREAIAFAQRMAYGRRHYSVLV